MDKNKGFITIISLLVMGIMLTLSLFLIYISKMEYIILNSSKDNIQAYYSAESKIYMILDMDEYRDLLITKIKKYLRTGRIKDKSIEIKKEHLLEGDSYKKIKMKFDKENDRRILQLTTSASCNKITNTLIAKIHILNDFYEMGNSIISEDIVHEDRLEEYIEYIDKIEDEIDLPIDDTNPTGIDCSDYEKINITIKSNGRKQVEFFRNNIETPIKTMDIGRNKSIFLVAKKDAFKPIAICIGAAEGLEDAKLQGTFYIEGDLEISSNLEIDGILIMNNGKLIKEPFTELNLNGLVLLRNHIGQGFENDGVKVNYNEGIIKVYGVNLPGFIEPKIKLIKRQ